MYGPGSSHLTVDPGIGGMKITGNQVSKSIPHQDPLVACNFENQLSTFLSEIRNKTTGAYPNLLIPNCVSCSTDSKCSTCNYHNDQASVEFKSVQCDPSPPPSIDESHQVVNGVSDEVHHLDGNKDGSGSEDMALAAVLIKCALINSRGFASKEASIRNIIVDEEIKILFVTETQCVLNEFPKVPGFFTFYRNRVKKKGGGIAILVADEFKGKARLLETSKDEMESLTVVLNGFSTPIYLTCYYGQQENTAEKGLIEDHLARLVGDARAASADGALVVVSGDFNLKN